MQQAKNEMLQNEILDEKNEVIEKAKELLHPLFFLFQ